MTDLVKPPVPGASGRVAADPAADALRLRLAVDAAGLGLWELDPSTGELTTSEGFARLHGRSAAEMPSDLEAYLDLVHPADRAGVRAAATSASEGGEPLETEYRVVTPDHSVRWINSVGRGLREPPTPATHVLGLARDVTDRREAAEERDRALAEARLLDDIAQSAAGEEDLGRMLTTVLQHLGSLVRFTGGSIALVEDDELVVRAASGPFAETALRQRAAHGTGAAWGIVEERRPLLSTDLPADGIAPRDGSPLRSYLAVPLIWRDTAFGLLEVDSTQPDAFDAADLRLVQAVGALLAGPIEAIRRRAAELAALARAEADRHRLRTIFEQAPAAIVFVTASDHRIEIANDQARMLFGGRDLAGRPIGEAVPEVQAQGMLAILDRIAASGEPYVGSEMPLEVRTADGERRLSYLDVVYQPTHGPDGRVEGILAFAVDVTARVEARDRLARQAEALGEFKASLDATEDGVVMFDPADLRIFYVNRGLADQVGRSPSELVRLTPLDLWPGLDADSWAELLAPLERGGASRTLTSVQRRADGTEQPVEIVLQYVAPEGGRGRFLAVVRDVSERVEARIRLQRLAMAERDRAAELHAMIEAIGEAVVVCAADGTVTLSNPAAAALLGNAPRRYDEVLARLDLDDETAPRLGAPERYGPQEVRLLGAAERWAELTAYPVVSRNEPLDEPTDGPTPIATILVLREVTLAREARVARDTYIGVLSHELRTPITAIYGGSKLLARPTASLTEEQHRSIHDDIEVESERLYRLVEDLLVLARFGETQEHVLGRDPVLLQRMLPAIVRSEQPRWPGTEFRLDLGERLPTVGADETYVEQVVRNLLANAAKYSGAGSTVTVRARTAGDEVEVAVLDEGPGIVPDEADRLFQLFYRSPATATRAGGAGIGLFVCKRLVESMGGRVWARPRESGGAEFGFSLRAFVEDEAL